MTKTKDVFYLVLGLLMIVGVLLVLIFSIKAFIDALSNLNTNQTTLLIAIVPSSVSILGLAFSNYLQKSTEITFKNRLKKEALYETFVDIMYEFIYRAGVGESTEDLLPKVKTIRKDLIVWGSDEVVKTYSEFMTIAQDLPENDPTKETKISAQLEKTILAIRKDLGYKNTKLIFGDLLRYFR